MKDSELLRMGRLLLENRSAGDITGVCEAIRAANLGRNTWQVQRLITWVKKMLGNSSKLEIWLYENNHITTEQFMVVAYRIRGSDYRRLLKKLLQTRLAWLDWMIAECEKAEVIK